MTAVEISNMSLEHKSKKVFGIVNNNSEAKDWFEKYVVLVGNNGYTTENFFGMFLAVWTN